MSVIRVLLVDDHAIVRAGLRALIEGQSDMNVVGDSGDGAEALALVVSSEPDIVVLDLVCWCSPCTMTWLT
jgi:DNA-binding NarL/FixJ family response regulator